MRFGLLGACQRKRAVGIAIVLCIAVAGPLCPSATRGQGTDGQPVIGDMIVQIIPPKYYVYGTFETDFKSMGKPVVQTLDALMKAAKENKIALVGPVLDCYYGTPHQDPNKTFKMDTGFFLREKVPSLGDFKVRELPTFKCATVLYVGPAPRIGEAWQKVHRAIQGKGLTPTEDERELYLYWEGVDSPNNIVQVQVGLKTPEGKTSKP